MRLPRDVPPTAGLPLTWRDLAGGNGGADLASAVAGFLGVGSVGIASSGTAALVVVLEALRRRSPRRTVVVPAYTCPLVPLAVARVGLRVRLCDVTPGRPDLDPAALDAACDADVLAVVPTHLGGLAADLEPVLAIAARAGAAVVEDAAQALGATWRGRPVGTIGDAGIFSLSRGKGLTIYEGGFWVARDPGLAAAAAGVAAELLVPRADVECLRIAQLVGYRLLYHPAGLRFAYGIPLRRALARGDLLGAVGDRYPSAIPLHRVGGWRSRVGASALARLPEAVAANASRGRARASELGRIPGIAVVGETPGTVGTWPFLTVLAESVTIRERVMESLWTAGLGVSRLFLHDLTGYDALAAIVPRAAVPNARAFAAQSFTVSNSEHLRDEEFARARDAIALAAGECRRR